MEKGSKSTTKKINIVKRIWLSISYFFLRYMGLSIFGMFVLVIACLTYSFIVPKLGYFLIYVFCLVFSSFLICIFFLLLKYILEGLLYKRIGAGLLMGRIKNKVGMRIKNFSSRQELIDVFYSGMLSIPEKYLNKGNIRTCTHEPIIRALVRRFCGTDSIRLERLNNAQNQEFVIDCNGHKYIVYVSYKKHRYLYEAAHLNKGLSNYFKIAYPKRAFFDVEIPSELIKELKKH